MDENEIREALNRHWAASDANDFDGEHDIYWENAVLEYPQSGERPSVPMIVRQTARASLGSG